MLMVDLLTAFDIVDHQIRCNQLQAMEYPILNVLIGQKQLVNVNGTESNLVSISCGVT